MHGGLLRGLRSDCQHSVPSSVQEVPAGKIVLVGQGQAGVPLGVGGCWWKDVIGGEGIDCDWLGRPGREAGITAIGCK